MLYYQLPMFFFFGWLLYLFPDVAKVLGMSYLALIVLSYSLR